VLLNSRIAIIADLSSGPFEMGKTVSQLESLRNQNLAKVSPLDKAALGKAKGSIASMVELYNTRGPRSLYTGVKLHLYREIFGGIIYYDTWEVTKQYAYSTNIREYIGETTVNFICGGIVGLFSTTVVSSSQGLPKLTRLTELQVYPLDTLKTIYMREYVRLPPGSKLGPYPKVTMAVLRSPSTWQGMMFSPLIHAPTDYVTDHDQL